MTLPWCSFYIQHYCSGIGINAPRSEEQLKDIFLQSIKLPPLSDNPIHESNCLLFDQSLHPQSLSAHIVYGNKQTMKANKHFIDADIDNARTVYAFKDVFEA